MIRQTKKSICFYAVLLLMSVFFIAACGKKEAVLPASETETQSSQELETQLQTELQTELQTQAQTAEISSLDVNVTKETAPVFTQTDETVYVTGDQVNLRSEGSTSAQVVATLKKGTALKRTGYSEQWSKVIYEEKEYYISSTYVSTTKPEEPAAAAPTLSGNGTGKIIAIDAGHQTKGMTDKEPNGPGSSVMKAKVTSGATGVATGLPEYKLNLAVSLKLKEELLARGYQVFMVRETNDVTLSNVERAVMANESGADIFIRVHANSLNDSSVRGTLTMCMTKNNPYYPSLYNKSSALSKLVTNGICDTTGFRNRGVQETDTMTGINWCTIPTSIVEMGFMSNAEEDRLMATDEYQTKIAKGIADGIDAYYAQGN